MSTEQESHPGSRYRAPGACTEEAHFGVPRFQCAETLALLLAVTEASQCYKGGLRGKKAYLQTHRLLMCSPSSPLSFL